MTTRNETSAYVASHGKQPRGSGYWCLRGPGGYVYWHSGTLTEARRAAVSDYRSHNGFAPRWLSVQP